MSTEVLVKKDLILGGLTCAHCAEEIGKGVRKIDGIVDSNMNFVNKKLTVLFDSAYNEEEVIKAIIKKIDSIEPGLDIQVVDKSAKKAKAVSNKREMILGGLTCAHCAEEIGNAISKMEGVKNSYLNFVNKKLLVELHPNKDEEILIKLLNVMVEIILTEGCVCDSLIIDGKEARNYSDKELNAIIKQVLEEEKKQIQFD